MYTISKEFSFSASHQLTGLAEGHPCMRMHGHNYRVQAILRCPNLDEHGFVVDYNDLKPFADYLSNSLDHRHLNDILVQPTAENLARHLHECFMAWSYWPQCALIMRVSETDKTWAEYSEN